MYDYNSIEGKLARIEELKKFVNLIGEIPGDHLGYLDARGISQYLIDIKRDLERQVAPEIAKRQNIKRYRYYYVNEDITIEADSGDEAERQFKKLNKGKDPEGDIELYDLVTGEKSIMYKLDLGTPVNF